MGLKIRSLFVIPVFPLSFPFFLVIPAFSLSFPFFLVIPVFPRHSRFSFVIPGFFCLSFPKGICFFTLYTEPRSSL